MTGKTDKIKGKVKELAGKALKKPSLQQEGRRDQAIGEAKEVAARAGKNIKRGAKRAAKSARRAMID